MAALRGATDAMAPGGRLLHVRGLREGGAPWLLEVAAGAGEVVSGVLRTGDPRDDEVRMYFGTEVAALAYAEDCGLPAPRLIAVDVDGNAAGEMAVLTTVLPGSSRIPHRTSPERMRALGAAVAILSTIEVAPGADLRPRDRPQSDIDFAGSRRALDADALHHTAQSIVDRLPVPAGRTVLVHGDLWQGNIMWDGEALAGIVDWDSAGAGHYGIDLGSIRFDAAIMFGPSAADEVLDGWQDATGQAADQLAYWDAVAALSTPIDMATWMPPIADQGRTDLDAHTVNGRRDAFLRAALDRLG